MFDVYILEKGTDLSELPQEGNYYLVTSDGPYLHKDTDLFSGLVKVKEIPFLGSVEPTIRVKLPKIPPDVILKSWLFFRRVFRQHRSEAELNLHYNKAKDDYMLVCRPQTASFGGVSYGLSRDKLIEDDEARRSLLSLSEQGYRKVGTIHSHCSFSAFHSGTDIGDESEKDGIHITIGHVDQDNFSLVASFAVNDNRFSLLPESVILGIEPKRQAQDQTSRWMSPREQASFFALSMPIERQQEIEADFQPVLDEWMEMVQERRSFFQPMSGGGGGGRREKRRRRREAMLNAPADQSVETAPETALEVVEGLPGVEVVQGLPSIITDNLFPLQLGDQAIIEGVPPPSGPVAVPVLATMDTVDLRLVRSHASALQNNNGKIPPERVAVLTDTLKLFFNKDEITSDDINLAARINPGRKVYEQAEA